MFFFTVEFYFTFVENKNKKGIGPLMIKTKGYSSLLILALQSSIMISHVGRVGDSVTVGERRPAEAEH